MPYIKSNRRFELEDAGLSSLAASVMNTGEFNYVISVIANQMVQNLPHKSYGDMSAIRGAILDAAEEYYRRLMVPYEDQKIKENGDVYG